jgi:hypothetical protein
VPRAAPEVASCLVQPGDAPEIPPATADPGSDAALDQYAAAERAYWGLDASPEAIAAAAADPSASSVELGTPLTPGEVREFAAIQRAAATVAGIDDSARGMDGYAGAYPDPAQRDVIDVVIAHQRCGLVEILRSDYPDQQLHAVGANDDLDLSALSGISKRFDEVSAELKENGVPFSTAGVSIPHNALVIDLLPESRRLRGNNPAASG